MAPAQLEAVSPRARGPSPSLRSSRPGHLRRSREPSRSLAAVTAVPTTPAEPCPTGTPESVTEQPKFVSRWAWRTPRSLPGSSSSPSAFEAPEAEPERGETFPAPLPEPRPRPGAAAPGPDSLLLPFLWELRPGQRAEPPGSGRGRSFPSRAPPGCVRGEAGGCPVPGGLRAVIPGWNCGWERLRSGQGSGEAVPISPSSDRAARSSARRRLRSRDAPEPLPGPIREKSPS